MYGLAKNLSTIVCYLRISELYHNFFKWCFHPLQAVISCVFKITEAGGDGQDTSKRFPLILKALLFLRILFISSPDHTSEMKLLVLSCFESFLPRRC